LRGWFLAVRSLITGVWCAQSAVDVGGLAAEGAFATMCGDQAVEGAVGTQSVDGHVDSRTFGASAFDHGWLVYGGVQWVSVIKGGGGFWTAMCGDHAVWAAPTAWGRDGCRR
jgi:hypothetical protein